MLYYYFLNHLEKLFQQGLVFRILECQAMQLPGWLVFAAKNKTKKLLSCYHLLGENCKSDHL